MTDEILTAEEVCSYLKLPRSSLYLLARSKKIPAIRIGKHWRFRKERITAWLLEQEDARVSRK